MQLKKDNDLLLIDMIQSGIYTQQELADFFGLKTRQGIHSLLKTRNLLHTYNGKREECLTKRKIERIKRKRDERNKRHLARQDEIKNRRNILSRVYSMGTLAEQNAIDYILSLKTARSRVSYDTIVGIFRDYHEAEESSLVISNQELGSRYGVSGVHVLNMLRIVGLRSLVTRRTLDDYVAA